MKKLVILAFLIFFVLWNSLILLNINHAHPTCDSQPNISSHIRFWVPLRRASAACQLLWVEKEYKIVPYYKTLKVSYDHLSCELPRQ
jgi:hypothetical protein